MNKEQDNRNTKLLAKLTASAERRVLRLGMDYVNKSLWYGLDIGGEFYFLRTGHAALTVNELPDGITAQVTLQVRRFPAGGSGDTCKVPKLMVRSPSGNSRITLQNMPNFNTTLFQ